MRIAASLMCADLWQLGEQVAALQAAGVDSLHFDVMDGSFVPNLGLGPQVYAAVRQHSALPCDVHLMVSQPADIIPLYPGAEYIIVHAEAASARLPWLLDDIARRGSHPGVALSPDTDPSTLAAELDQLRLVLIMTVHPGFAGRPFLPAMVRKVEAVRDLLARRHSAAVICVDGAISPATVPALTAAGASIFVGGSSGLFLPGVSFAEAVKRLRQV